MAWPRRTAVGRTRGESTLRVGQPLAAVRAAVDVLPAAGFPPATYHLRRVRLKDSSILSLLADPLKAKLPLIESLFTDYPHRTFVLVGDSGERDPEIYGELARRHPDQVARIFLRDVTGEPANRSDTSVLFRTCPRKSGASFRTRRSWQVRSARPTRMLPFGNTGCR